MVPTNTPLIDFLLDAVDRCLVADDGTVYVTVSRGSYALQLGITITGADAPEDDDECGCEECH